ncbi:Crp/Fnr family transcriptional regulator [Bacteroides helcogenes]|uniref:Transcriptional regulator, Crp/Fnr family n=1 Tax=Bacteroides helcogenes (strain ATCC 35417 / DSM 20613 / JCM 6297 / CCUG 15421 / P 36-108) TaxID=693979 RepID=E6SP65_BACT6|nr:Crp/Fnr family transcriptional regulator [Bacteroides helcogenes]ADV43835.1 transcriptional regulator, Crp/Fnr family [Bacteroides helcogenes P 36-108]MDY5237465.1 Crp/Fnr family transcriptional regulator [Bacteroides helcogenes]
MEIHVLLKMPPFRGITEQELLPLILTPEHACRLYKPSDLIALQGEVYRSLFILCSGSVRTQMVNAEGKQLTIETLKAPELLAPAFVFSSENRFPVNIEAKERCEILVINKKGFLEFLHQHPVVMHNFLQLVSDRTLFLSKKLNSFALQSLKSRILNYLRIHGAIVNQQEVAQILGVARPSLARALSELINENCIRTEGKEIRIDEANSKRYL